MTAGEFRAFGIGFALAWLLCSVVWAISEVVT